MSIAEHPVDTVTRFSKSWSSNNTNSLLAELVTISKETNRKPDSYHFLVRESVLIDPNTEKPVLDFVIEGTEKKVVKDLQDWASNNEEGLALWISPKEEGKYPCPKVIIHRIAYNENREKIVLNSTIIFDAEIHNPGYKRQTLYTLPDEEINIFKILKWINKKAGEEINFEQPTNISISHAEYFRDKIQSGIPAYVVIREMQTSGFIGDKPISCPSSSGGSTLNSYSNTTEVFGYHSNETDWHSGTCRVCGNSTWVGPCSICKPCESKF